MLHQKKVINQEKGRDGKDPLTEEIIGAAIEVHRHLGPGLLERTYLICLMTELEVRGLKFEAEKLVPVNYRGVEIESGFRLDLLVENQVIVELKSVQAIEPVHEAQLITYLKLTGHKVGLLINFNVPKLIDGVKRKVN